MDKAEWMTMRSRDDRLRRVWDKQSDGYDRGMAFLDRWLFGDTRSWLCGQASGDVLEVAVGTGLNLPHYPPDVRITGVDFSDKMLEIARRRAAELGRDVDLRRGDAHSLDLPDASFDTVVCTYALCSVRDDRAVVREMARVLRPGGLLLLADHVAASAWPARVAQWLIELGSVPLNGEHFTRRPIEHVIAAGLAVERHERFKLGIVERLTARK